MLSACPTETRLLEHMHERGVGPLTEHIDRCADCNELLVAFAQLLSSVPSVAPLDSAEPDGLALPMPGDRLGRYELLERLGRGAMGIVYLAHDPDLDRRVALKVVAPMVSEGQARHTAQLRLLREAKVAARLLHPNVVAIHDCGTFGDRVFVAMEYVDGSTLDTWLAAKPRGRDEIVGVFEGAARGLAAAHRAGLVHRDVKPSNILIGKDGTAKIGDFGLSEANDEQVAATPRLRGTPAYMAPEALAGTAADARSDEFALCVTLHEALVGRRPFVGSTISALSAAIAGGLPARPNTIPRWLYRALQRGLAVRPDDRFATVDELADVLGRRGSRRGRNVALAGFAVVAASISAAWILLPVSTADRCPTPHQELATAWNATYEVLLRARQPAGKRAEQIVTSFNAYADQWIRARVEACRDTRERGAYSEAVLDLRTDCLTRARAQLATLVSLLVDGERDEIERAVSAAQRLPDLARCADVTALGKRVQPPDRSMADRVGKDRAEIDRAFALFDLGRSKQALDIVDAVAPRVRTLGYRTLEAELGYVQANALDQLGRSVEARAAFEQALQAARAGGDERIEVQCALGLAALLRGPETRKDAQLWLSHAASVLERFKDDRLMAAMLERRGVLAFEGADYASAAADLGACLALREKRLGGSHKDVAVVRASLGATLAKLGRSAEARTELERAIKDLGAARGPDHPSVGSLWNSLGSLEMSIGRVKEARDAFEKARGIIASSLGVDHPKVAQLDLNIATIAQQMNDFDRAERIDRAVLAAFVKAGKGNGAEALIAREGLATIALRRHQLRPAETSYRELVVANTRLYGPEHVYVGRAHFNLAMVLITTGRLDEAEPEFRAARALYAKAHGATSPLVASVDVKLAFIAYKRRQWSAAAALVEPLLVRDDLHPDVSALVRYNLARVLWARDHDRARARKLGQEAIAIYEHSDPDQAAVVKSWLREHGLVEPDPP